MVIPFVLRVEKILLCPKLTSRRQAGEAKHRIRADNATVKLYLLGFVFVLLGREECKNSTAPRQCDVMEDEQVEKKRTQYA